MPGFLIVRVLGLAATLRKLGGMNEALAEGEQKGVERGAKIVERRLRERTNRLDPGDLAKVGKLPKGEKRRISAARRIRTGALSEDFLRVRSGNLRASVNSSRAEADGKSWKARVGFRSGVVDKYAPVHEFGLTIPKRGKKGGTIKMPERAPVRKSLADRREQVQKMIRFEVEEAVRRLRRR